MTLKNITYSIVLLGVVVITGTSILLNDKEVRLVTNNRKVTTPKSKLDIYSQLFTFEDSIDSTESTSKLDDQSLTSMRLSMENLARISSMEKFQMVTILSDRQSSEPLPASIRHALVTELASIDAEAALEIIAFDHNSDIKNISLPTILAHLSTKDLERAATLAKLSSPELRDKSFSRMSNQIVTTDPIAALDLAMQIEGNELMQNAAVNSFQQWASADSVNALNWLDLVEDKQVKTALESQTLHKLATSNGASTADYLARNALNNDPIAVAVTQRWARTEPAAAITWISTEMAKTDQTIKALSTIMREWKLRDSVSAEQWLKAQSHSQIKDLSLSAYCLSFSASEVNQALDWISIIDDEAIKQRTLSLLSQ